MLSITARGQELSGITLAGRMPRSSVSTRIRLRKYDPQGSLTWEKVYDGALHVSSAGLAVDTPVRLMDLMPTLAKLAGTSAPDDRIIDGHDQTQTVETARRAVDDRGRNNRRQRLLGTPIRSLDLENVDQELAADVDASDPRVHLLSELRTRALDPLEHLVRATTSEGRTDEAAQAGRLLVGHYFNCIPLPS